MGQTLFRIKYQQSLPCNSLAWLGISYYNLSRPTNKTWTDGSDVTFAMPTVPIGAIGAHHKHYVTGSYWQIGSSPAISICQLRIGYPNYF